MKKEDVKMKKEDVFFIKASLCLIIQGQMEEFWLVVLFGVAAAVYASRYIWQGLFGKEG